MTENAVDFYNQLEDFHDANNGMYDAASSEVSDDDKDEVYKSYHSAVNMSASRLETWAANECSKRASVNRSPITRNLRLLRTAKAEWTNRDYSDANRTISFVSRMLGVEDGQPVNADCPYSKKFISLANWARWHSKKHG